MKHSITLLSLGITGALFLSASLAQAQSFTPGLLQNSAFGVTLNVTFDENGKGSINGNAVQGILLADASNGGKLDLTYDLTTISSTIGAGDVTVLDSSGAISDAIRFTNAKGELTGGVADRMIFYSTDSGDLADTGLPRNLGTGSLGGPVTEEGENFAYGNVYFGTSGSTATTPEPGSVTFLVGMGVSGAGLLIRRRRLSCKSA